MTIDPAMREQAEARLAELMNLVRVRLDRALVPPVDGGRTEAQKLWDETYGHMQFSGESYEEVAIKIGEMLEARQTMAAAVVTFLAAELAEAQGRLVTAILDEVELKLGHLIRTASPPLA